jgi:hypothetical protein
MLARHGNNCTNKLQTNPLVREGTPHQETRKCQTVKQKSDHGPQMGARNQDTLTDKLRQNSVSEMSSF